MKDESDQPVVLKFVCEPDFNIDVIKHSLKKFGNVPLLKDFLNVCHKS